MFFWTRTDLKNQAKALLNRSYWTAFLVSLFVALFSMQVNISIDSGVGIRFALFQYHWGSYHGMPHYLAYMFVILTLMLIAIAFKLFFMNPLQVGKCYYYLNENIEKGKFTNLFAIFSMEGYFNIVKILFIRDFKIFLWSLLLVVPGIVKSFEYRMIPFILAENSTLSSEEVFNKTKIMMTGDKLNAFILDLSFFGWIFVGSLLFGIGVFFVYPYIDATEMYFYSTLKGKLITSHMNM